MTPSRTLASATVAAMIVITSLLVADSAAEDFDDRVSEYVAGLPDNAWGAYGAVARLAKGKPVDVKGIQDHLTKINSRRDCSDFQVAALLRLMFLDRRKPSLPDDVRKAVTDTLLNFKYWIDEPGRDSMCYWSENHQILYHSAEYLVGTLFPDRVFPNSRMTGREHVEKGRRLVQRWLSWRERFGFSEWLSNCYYEEDLFALFNLADFSPDEEIRQRATMVLDLLFLNMALNSYRGMFLCTHGRSYERQNKSGRGDSLRKTSHLLWGAREFTPDVAGVGGSAVSACTSSYRLPPAILGIGRDTSTTFENYQWHGIRIEEAPELGLRYDDLNSGMFFWGSGMYTHPLVLKLTARMWDEYDLVGNTFFGGGLAGVGIALNKAGVFDSLMTSMKPATAGAYLDDARTYNYHTPDYMLSCAQDRRAGQIGGQNFVWTAVLGLDAVVFTTYPGRVMAEGDSGYPCYWVGNGSNPRAAQYKNVLVAVYNAPRKLAFGESGRCNFSHAWFPKSAFDETRQQGKWFFGRKGKGYVALYSHNAAKYVQKGENADKEIVAKGLKNVWICEAGRATESGSFDDFVRKVSSAKVRADGLQVQYASPGVGEVEFGWKGPLAVGGKEVELRRDVRFDNPFVKAPRFARKFEVRCGKDVLILDFENRNRVIRRMDK